MTDQLTAGSNSWIVETWSQSSPVRAPCKPAQSSVGEGENLLADVLVRTMTHMLRCADPKEACRLLANRLQQFLGCRQVAVGICSGHRRECHLHGLSGVVRFDSHSRFVAGIQDAVDETLAHESENAWPPRETGGDHAALAHEKLLGILGADCVASVPLRNEDGLIVGVVLFVNEPAERAFELSRRYGTAMATCLEAVKQRGGSALARRGRRVRRTLSSWRGRALCAAAVGLIFLLMLPWPYRITCQCEIQPVTRRFVVAPYDGTLESSQVAPGDVVKSGDLLARMDEREIRWEVASLQADYARAKKERDAAMAAHNTGAAQLAKLDMERLDTDIELLKHRIDHLAVRSPLDGIIVAGDLERTHGAPLKVGQTLFEVAPLGKMTVEVNVPEEDIAFVTQGAEVIVHMDAFPNTPLAGTVQRIHPQAEIRDENSVFVAEFEKTNMDQRLRPGMNGWARISTQKKRLGWILFHKPWARLQRALAW